jgi:DNA (cytosine-5)-methyltransferase 1
VRIGSLFSGAGGLDMAVEAVFGGHTVWHSEIDKAASKVLAHRWPDVPNLGSITKIDWATVEPVDVLCGGFPCQDVSAAGKRAGIKDGTRSGLWAIFAEAIDALRPQYVVIENVRGLLSAAAHRAGEDDEQSGDVESGAPVMGNGAGQPVLRAAGAVLGDLADLGYDAVWATVAAADVGAPHRRERVFIVATDATESERRGTQQQLLGAPARRASKHRECAGSAAGCHGDVASPSRYGWDEGRPESAGIVGGFDAAQVTLLPTPRVGGGGDCESERRRKSPGLESIAVTDLLPTPRTSDTSRSGGRIDEPLLGGQAREMQSAWGKYEPAIRRWEQIVGPAPAPTEPNKNNNPRLSAAFSEWLMGWPAGWVTDPDIGISRNDQLRILGNGVVVQQAIAALRYLLAVAS